MTNKPMNTRKFCKEQGWKIGTQLTSKKWWGPRKITGFGQSVVVMRYKGAAEHVVYKFPEDVKERDPADDA